MINLGHNKEHDAGFTKEKKTFRKIFIKYISAIISDSTTFC